MLNYSVLGVGSNQTICHSKRSKWTKVGLTDDVVYSGKIDYK